MNGKRISLWDRIISLIDVSRVISLLECEIYTANAIKKLKAPVAICKMLDCYVVDRFTASNLINNVNVVVCWFVNNTEMLFISKNKTIKWQNEDYLCRLSDKYAKSNDETVFWIQKIAKLDENGKLQYDTTQVLSVDDFIIKYNVILSNQ